MKKQSKYKKVVIIYSSILLILMLSALVYVYTSLKGFEKNQPENYIKNILTEAKSNPSKYIKLKKEHIDSYKDVLKTANLKVEADKDSYVVYADELALLNVKLNTGKKVTKLGLLTYQILSLKEIIPISDHGAYYYVIKIPSSFTLKVNDQVYKKYSEKEKHPEFESIDNDTLPEIYVYKLSNLNSKPKIEIYNNRQELVKYTKEGNIISYLDFYKTNDYKKHVKEPIDILEFAQKWSLYFTNDLKGGNKGFDSLKEYLIPDSKMWTTAETWIKSTDRNFVSRHTFADPAFSNESVSDCHIYSDEAFSCLVKLDKNLLVGRARTPQTDKLNDRMYFVYDNGWKFIEMKFNLD